MEHPTDRDLIDAARKAHARGKRLNQNGALGHATESLIVLIERLLERVEQLENEQQKNQA